MESNVILVKIDELVMVCGFVMIGINFNESPKIQTQTLTATSSLIWAFVWILRLNTLRARDSLLNIRSAVRIADLLIR